MRVFTITQGLVLVPASDVMSGNLSSRREAIQPAIALSYAAVGKCLGGQPFTQGKITTAILMQGCDEFRVISRVTQHRQKIMIFAAARNMAGPPISIFSTNVSRSSVLASVSSNG